MCLIDLVCRTEFLKLKCTACQKVLSRPVIAKFIDIFYFSYVDYACLNNETEYKVKFRVEAKEKYKRTSTGPIERSLPVHSMNIVVFKKIFEEFKCTFCCQTLVPGNKSVVSPTNFKNWKVFKCAHCNEDFCCYKYQKLCMTNIPNLAGWEIK